MYLNSLMLLLYSFLLFLLWFVFRDPTPGGQGDVDVEDCHNNYRKIEGCYSCPECHCRVRKELQKERKKERKPSINWGECLQICSFFNCLHLHVVCALICSEETKKKKKMCHSSFCFVFLHVLTPFHSKTFIL